ncbi:hypothetical protein Tco_0953700 [Tanacetum coccineum]|uniref:Uncharacterized protein n=1 Tax=Tanacetum coccineum TaxID=301880 RepID=A0ABQ5E0N3_9ASTR
MHSFRIGDLFVYCCVRVSGVVYEVREAHETMNRVIRKSNYDDESVSESSGLANSSVPLRSKRYRLKQICDKKDDSDRVYCSQSVSEDGVCETQDMELEDAASTTQRVLRLGIVAFVLPNILRTPDPR